jgi:hypothetical protein
MKKMGNTEKRIPHGRINESLSKYDTMPLF